jgi:hypothetical protein
MFYFIPILKAIGLTTLKIGTFSLVEQQTYFVFGVQRCEKPDEQDARIHGDLEEQR